MQSGTLSTPRWGRLWRKTGTQEGVRRLWTEGTEFCLVSFRAAVPALGSESPRPARLSGRAALGSWDSENTRLDDLGWGQISLRTLQEMKDRGKKRSERLATSTRPQLSSRRRHVNTSAPKCPFEHSSAYNGATRDSKPASGKQV